MRKLCNKELGVVSFGDYATVKYTTDATQEDHLSRPTLANGL